jgi:hypothetical protein
VSAYPDPKFEGRVRQVRLQSTLVENVVNYTVVIGVENDDRLLLPGMTATVDFYVETAKDVLKIQNAALRFRPTPEMLASLRAGGPPSARSESGRTERPGARLWIQRRTGNSKSSRFRRAYRRTVDGDPGEDRRGMKRPRVATDAAPATSNLFAGSSRRVRSDSAAAHVLEGAWWKTPSSGPRESPRSTDPAETR